MSTETMTIEPPTVAAETTYPHLVFEIDSAGAANTIYVTSDASVNDITLKIATTATATFTPATTVVPESQASTATGSLLYLDLTPLQLTSAEFEAISPKTSGWQIVMFPAGQLIGMTPDADTTLEVNDTIDISIGALAPAQATGASVSLTVNVFRVGGITIGNLPFPTNFSVALATPPVGGQDLSQDLTVDLATPDVVNSIPGYDPVNNQLAFAFFAGPRGRAVTPGPASQFNLSFVYATDPSGYGALCTPDQVKPPFEVITGVNASAWKITPNRSEQSPSWTLRPPTTGPIVREGPLGTVGILANNLITNFQPGPTLALISYSGFDGYADGVFTLPIEKHGHVAINSLTVTPNPTVLDNGAAEVTVSWKVQNAGTMTLAPFDVDVTDKPSYQGTITDTTQITLTAEGTYLSSAGNIAIRNTTAVVLPVIDSFDATPRAAYAGDLPREIDLSWNVNTNEQLQLKSSAEPPDPNRYNAVGTVSKVISEPQMFTLVPLGQSGGPTVERSIVVSAFTPQTSSWPLTASFVAAPPNASFVLASDGKANVVAVDTMVYKPVSGPVPVGAAPAGMAFSADGSRLYVANSGDGTVSVLTVAATASAPQYEFTSVGSVTVGGSPRELALSPDSKYLYVTVDGGSGAGRLVVLSAAGQPTVISTLNVGTAPRGLTVMPSGAQIFVANSGSSTVTVIGRAPDGHHSVVDTLTGVSTARDVAVSPDGNTLLVVCPTAGAVIAINAVHPQAPRNTITVGSSPQQVALVPGGAYAVITNQGDGTVSLLTVGSTPSACRQLAGGIAVGSNPDAVAVTPDAGLVLVGCSGPDALAVVTLAEYQTAQAPPAIGGQPTGVRVAPDGKTAVGWHDANQYFSIGKPSTGLFVYDVASETVTPQLATTPVIDFIYDPTTDASAAFLVQHGQQNVSLVATDTWSVTSTIDLSADTTGTPVALASSGDGTIVFVLTADTSAHCKLLVLDGSTGSYSVSDAVAVLTSSVGSGLTLTTLADGSQVFVTDEASGNLVVVAGSPGSYAVSGTPIQVGSLPVAAALSPDGTQFYVTCNGSANNGTLAALDTASHTLKSVVLPPNAYTSLAGLAVSPDGTRLFATDVVAASVRVFDAASLRLVQTIGWDSGVRMPNGLAVALDGARLFTANTNSGNLGVIAQVQASAGGAVGAPASGRTLDAGVEGLGDGAYQGLFVRDYVGQTPATGNTTGAWTDCPDIWPSGQQLLPDPATTLVAGYGNDSPNVIYTSGAGVNNYIYVRGLNATNGQNTSRIWLYYVNGGGDASLMTWPPSWLNAGVSALKTGKGYIEVSSAALNEVDFTYPPFVWDAVPVTGHYCILAWVENPPLSEPAVDPRPGIGSIGTYNQLAAFIQSHPNMGWKNTLDQPTTSGESWEVELPFAGPPIGGLFKAGVQFNNAPTDGFFSYSIPGPTPATSAYVPKTPVTNAGESYFVPLNWSGFNNYNTNMIVTYWAGPSGWPQGANIQAAAGTNSAALVGMVEDPLAGARRVRVYPTHAKEDGFKQEWTVFVGMVQINPKTS